MFLFRRKTSSANLSSVSSSTSSLNGGNVANKRQFTFAIQVESIENIPLYMQIPLSVEIYKLNNALNASSSQMTIKGKLFRKKKLIGSTPFKLVDSSSQKSNYMTTMEFLCNVPYNDNLNCLVKGPVTSTTVFPPINEAITNVVEDTSSSAASTGDGKFLQVIVNKKLHTNNKVEFVNEMLVDLTHYCLLSSEYQCRISIPIEISTGVIVNINMIIYSTIGNQLTGRKSGSLDLSRPMSATNLKDLTTTSPPRDREENTTRSPTVEPSPKISPQINRVLSVDLDDSSPINNNPSTPNGSTSSLNGNGVNGGFQDFFKRRAELNSGRSRSGSSPIAMQHIPHSPQPSPESILSTNSSSVANPYTQNNYTQNMSNGFTDATSPSLIDTGVVPNQEESIETLKQENQQLKSVLQRAKIRFQEVVSENSQLKERIKQLEEQMALLQTSKPLVNSTSKDLLDFF